MRTIASSLLLNTSTCYDYVHVHCIAVWKWNSEAVWKRSEAVWKWNSLEAKQGPNGLPYVLACTWVSCGFNTFSGQSQHCTHQLEQRREDWGYAMDSRRVAGRGLPLPQRRGFPHRSLESRSHAQGSELFGTCAVSKCSAAGSCGLVEPRRPGPQAQADQSLLDVYRHYLQRRIDDRNAKNKAVG